MVKIVIGNIYSKIVGYLPDEVNDDLNKILSYKVANSRFMKIVKDGRWDGIVRLYYKNKGQTFHAGLMTLVRETLKKHNAEYEIVDRRVRPEKNLPDLKFVAPPDYEERQYQNFTVERAIRFTRGILCMATGSGKSLVAVRIIAGIQTYPVVFYVLTKDLMEQARGVLSACLNEKIGTVGDGIIDIKKITVCTIQSAVQALNYGQKKFKIDDYKFDDEDTWDEKSIDSQEKADKIKEMIKEARVVVFDECQHVASRTATLVLSSSDQAYWRYGLSATPEREDGANLAIQSQFGVKVVQISASYLIKNGDLVKPYIFIERIDSKSTFHTYAKVYENAVVKNDKFNKHVADTVNHLVGRGLSVLLLVKQIKHGEYLQKLIPNSKFITSRLKSVERLQCINDLRAGKITLLGTSLMDEGSDIRGLDAVVIAGLGKSTGRVFQRIGRCLRKDKKSIKQKDKAIVVIYDHCNTRFLDKHAKKIRSILKREPEFVVIDSNGPDYIFREIDGILGVKDNQLNLFNS